MVDSFNVNDYVFKHPTVDLQEDIVYTGYGTSTFMPIEHLEILWDLFL